MDEEMILLDNVMPVEIALKRELEYRRKVEALRNQQSGSMNDDFHLQVPVPSLTGTDGTKTSSSCPAPSSPNSSSNFRFQRPHLSPVGAKRKAPSSHSQGFCSLSPSCSHQAFQTQPAGLACMGPYPSPVGTKRKAPSVNSQGFCSLPPSCSHQAFQKQPAGLVCMVCSLSFSTLYYLKQHCTSLAHADKLLQMKKWGISLGNHICCKLCNAPCSSVLVLEQHLNGIKHAASLQELENVKLGREAEAKLHIFNESTGTEDTFFRKKERKGLESGDSSG